jgi:hypothetical protein
VYTVHGNKRLLRSHFSSVGGVLLLEISFFESELCGNQALTAGIYHFNFLLSQRLYDNIPLYARFLSCIYSASY